VKVLLLQVDGKLPNLALMRISAHHKAKGDDVTFRLAEHPSRACPQLGDSFDQIYASAIFERSRPICKLIEEQWPGAIIGGTGWNLETKVEDFGIDTAENDWTLYPKYEHSIGFTQRGCRLTCSFCVVPRKEGKIKPAATISEIYRGDPHPRNIVLLDNDFFGQPEWKKRIREILDGDFRVSFNQGVNARCITEEAAEAIASVKYYDDDFTQKRIYTAWDNRKDEERLMAGLRRLVKYGVKPSSIMVYMLIGYWPGETHEDREYRRKQLRDFGAVPYPMAFRKLPELVNFQRWVIRAWDKVVPWDEWLERQKHTDYAAEAPTPTLDGFGAEELISIS
jgi:Radical SAM superfamily